MLYIYCPRVSEGARELEDTLNDIGVPSRFTQGKLLRDRFRPDRDKLICWGAHAPGREGLNNVPPMSKFDEAVKLKEAGVATVEVSRTRPAVGPARRPDLDLGDGMFHMDEAGARALLQRIQAYLDAPLPPVATWLPRRNNHIGGADLLQRLTIGDYYSKKENINEEYRIHIFNGKSIRAGVKVRREGVQAHDWIRSFDAGWRIQYDGFTSSKEQRQLAADAVKALGLTFGAVDLGRRDDGTLLVLEVNRAPGIEGGSVMAYATKIQAYLTGGDNAARA